MDHTHKFDRDAVGWAEGRALAFAAGASVAEGIAAFVATAEASAVAEEPTVVGLVVTGQVWVDGLPVGLVEVAAEVVDLVVAGLAVGQLVEEASVLAATEQVVVLVEVSVVAVQVAVPAANLAVVRAAGLAVAGVDPEATEVVEVSATRAAVVARVFVAVATEVSVVDAEVYLRVPPSPIHFQPAPRGSADAQCQESLESPSTEYFAQV